jgi:hypothetical protein
MVTTFKYVTAALPNRDSFRRGTPVKNQTPQLAGRMTMTKTEKTQTTK